MKLDPPLTMPEHEPPAGSGQEVVLAWKRLLQPRSAAVAANGNTLQPTLDDFSCLDGPMATDAAAALKELFTQGSVCVPVCVCVCVCVRDAQIFQIMLKVRGSTTTSYH